jgi:hypothetical protein
LIDRFEQLHQTSNLDLTPHGLFFMIRMELHGIYARQHGGTGNGSIHFDRPESSMVMGWMIPFGGWRHESIGNLEF